jgi:hypothetical protein
MSATASGYSSNKLKREEELQKIKKSKEWDLSAKKQKRSIQILTVSAFLIFVGLLII